VNKQKCLIFKKKDVAMLPEEKIKKLLEWFVNESSTRKNFLEYRKKTSEENHKWIQPDVIAKISDEEFENKMLEYYNTGGGRKALNPIFRDRIIRNKKRLRETILFLLNEEIDIKQRLDEILDPNGKYHIEGFGKSIATSLLMDFEPTKYCLWNNKTERGLGVLGFEKVYENSDLWGNAYLKVLDTLKKLIAIKPESNLTFEEIDLFLHTIAAEEEGIEAVKKISETDDSKSDDSDYIKFTPFEKHLEEFIVNNLSTIGLGSQLELYQDEEGNGRQYPTPVGYIDILAVDRKNKEFIVIELKKGKSSDQVVGQILRYMGWVRENLAKDYNVRGVIISGDKDEKLEYALKIVPSINLFIYEVSFRIKRVF